MMRKAGCASLSRPTVLLTFTQSIKLIFCRNNPSPLCLKLPFLEPEDQGPVVPRLPEFFHQHIVLQKLQEMLLSLLGIKMPDLFGYSAKGGATGQVFLEKGVELLVGQVTLFLSRCRCRIEFFGESAEIDMAGGVLEEEEAGNELLPLPHVPQFRHYPVPCRGKLKGVAEAMIIPELGLGSVGREGLPAGEILGEEYAGERPHRVNTAQVLIQERTGLFELQGDQAEPVSPVIGVDPENIMAPIQCGYGLTPVQGRSQKVN